MKSSLLATVLFATMLSLACSAPTTYYSDRVYYGNAGFGTFLTVEQNVPQAVGFEFSPSYLYDIPVPTLMIMDGKPMGMGSIELEIPDELSVYTPFQSIEVVNSAPHAFPYNKTHFDIYFSFLNTMMRASNVTLGTAPQVCGAGSVTPDSYCRGIKALPTRCCPKNYTNTGTVLSGVAGSIADALSPEKLLPTDPNFGPWVCAFSFLIYNSRIVGYKTMIPYDVLKDFASGARSTYCKDLRLPEIMPDIAYYPTGYCISHRGWSPEIRIQQLQALRHHWIPSPSDQRNFLLLRSPTQARYPSTHRRLPQILPMLKSKTKTCTILMPLLIFE